MTKRISAGERDRRRSERAKTFPKPIGSAGWEAALADRVEYKERMQSCRQFQYFGLVPIWLPGEGDIGGFIHDEVVRQFHDPRVADDGGCRVRWMENAWYWAMEQAEDHRYPTLEDIEKIGAMVEVKENAKGFRTCRIWIGNREGTPPERVREEMTSLWLDVDKVVPKQGRGESALYAGQNVTPTADDFYLAFEGIHPFRDGNGRSGKILHNWLLGTLDDPVLVEDYFHGGNP